MYNEIGNENGTYDRTVYSTVEDMKRFVKVALKGTKLHQWTR